MSGHRQASCSLPFDRSAVAALYQAALDAEFWPLALEALAAFTASSGGLLVCFSEPREAGLAVHVGLPDRLIEDYRNGRIRDCPRLAHALAQPEGTPLCDYQHIREEEMDSHSYYQWLQQAGEGTRYYLGCRLSTGVGESALLLLTFHRSEGHPRQADIDRFATLIPHLRRAFAVWQRLQRAESRAEALCKLLSQLPLPVALLDHQARIVTASVAFERAANRCGNCISVHNGAAVAGPPHQPAFERMLRKACNGDEGDAPAAVMEIARDGRTCALGMQALPVSGPTSPAGAYVALRLSGSCQAGASDLQTRFGFTPAEIRLATALLAGQDLAGASAAHGVALATTRTHLKAMFAKTGTSRQADLVRVLLSVPL